MAMNGVGKGYEGEGQVALGYLDPVRGGRREREKESEKERDRELVIRLPRYVCVKGKRYGLQHQDRRQGVAE